MKHIKDLWSTLKLLRVGPQDHEFGPDERQVVEEILSDSRNVHEKQRQGFEASWALLNRYCLVPHCIHPFSRPSSQGEAWSQMNKAKIPEQSFLGSKRLRSVATHAGRTPLMRIRGRLRESSCRRSRRPCLRQQRPGSYKSSLRSLKSSGSSPQLALGACMPAAVLQGQELWW